jgi:hypothetical protein
MEPKNGAIPSTQRLQRYQLESTHRPCVEATQRARRRIPVSPDLCLDSVCNHKDSELYVDTTLFFLFFPLPYSSFDGSIHGVIFAQPIFFRM